MARGCLVGLGVWLFACSPSWDLAAAECLSLGLRLLAGGRRGRRSLSVAALLFASRSACVARLGGVGGIILRRCCLALLRHALSVRAGRFRVTRLFAPLAAALRSPVLLLFRRLAFPRCFFAGVARRLPAAPARRRTALARS